MWTIHTHIHIFDVYAENYKCGNYVNLTSFRYFKHILEEIMNKDRLQVM